MAVTPGTETPPPPYLGRSVRIVGPVAVETPTEPVKGFVLPSSL